MKTGANFQEAGHSALDFDLPGGWLGDSAQIFKEGRFAGAIAADDANAVALLDLKGNILKCPKLFLYLLDSRRSAKWMEKPLSD